MCVRGMVSFSSHDQPDWARNLDAHDPWVLFSFHLHLLQQWYHSCPYPVHQLPSLGRPRWHHLQLCSQIPQWCLHLSFSPPPPMPCMHPVSFLRGTLQQGPPTGLGNLFPAEAAPWLLSADSEATVCMDLLTALSYTAETSSVTPFPVPYLLCYTQTDFSVLTVTDSFVLLMGVSLVFKNLISAQCPIGFASQN